MGYENLGPNVSQNPEQVTEPANGGGAYTSQDHSWDQVVIQQNKPSADWEINLLQSIFGNSGVRLLNQRSLPSGWLNPGFLERSDVTATYIFLNPDTTHSTTANLFQLLASDVNVNGWMVHFDLSQDFALDSVIALGLPQVTQGTNYVLMPAPPTGGQRTDLVILEVWRALVSPSDASPAPTNYNKSPQGQILRYGNAKCPDVNPNENLADDLVDPVYLQETARRVQVQYRYRTITGPIDILSYPDGLDDPTVTANTVPAYPTPGIDGENSGFSYVEVSGDSGLWVAGAGNPSSAGILGTVDGYMYAIPICAISRRNSAPFSRSTNLNGAGLMGSGVSGRPDGLYADQIVVGDVVDLRKGVAFDFTEVLQKVMEQVLDNSLSTEIETNQIYGLSNVISGTSFTFKDDITTPPSFSGATIGTSDGVRYDFSDRAVTESFTATSGLIAGPTSQITFRLSALTPAHTAPSTFNLSATAPTGTNISGLENLRMITSVPSDIDLLNLSSPFYAQTIIYSASVLNGPIDTVVIDLNTSASNFTINANFDIEYLNGNGVSRNVINPIALWTPPAGSIASWVDPTQLTITSDATRFALTNPVTPTENNNLWWMSIGHREVSARLRTLTQGPLTFYCDTPNTFWIPEKLTGNVTINDGTNPIYTTTSYVANDTYTQVTLNFTLTTNAPVTVSYTAMRPLHPVGGAPGDSYQIWYTTRAIQSIPVPQQTIDLPLLSRSISQQLHLMTCGSGSPNDPFPYPAPSAQIPVGLLPTSSYPESYLDSPNIISVVGFGINSGYLTLPAVIPYSPDPGQVQLYTEATDTTIDGDRRNFWPRSDPGIPSIYSPVSWAQSISFAQQHKIALPVLMELKTDFNGLGYGSIGRKGTLVLVVFSRLAIFDQLVNIGFQPILSDTCAAVYRVPGNLLNPRRVTP
jgi:hypothetical protein